MRLVSAGISLMVLMSALAFAQDGTPKWQVFGGYSLMHEGNPGLTDLKIDLALHDPSTQFGIKSYFNGWSAEGQYNANHWFGLAADIGGHSAVPFTIANPSGAAGLPSRSRYSFLVGPVLTYRTKSKFTPYVHALFGYELARIGASTLSGSVPPFSSVATSYTDFTLALGGGLDYKITPRISARLGQVDYFRTTLNQSSFYNNAFNTIEFDGLSIRQRNIRFSTGVVFSF